MGMILIEILDKTVGRQSTGKVFTYRERLWRQLPCPDCVVEFTTGYMSAHSRRLHSKFPEITGTVYLSVEQSTSPRCLNSDSTGS